MTGPGLSQSRGAGALVSCMKPASPDPVAAPVDRSAGDAVNQGIADREALLHRPRPCAATPATARERLHRTPVPLLREPILGCASRGSVPE